MRFLIELIHSGDERVEGVVWREESGQPQAFCGWVELLGLLEAPQGPPLQEP